MYRYSMSRCRGTLVVQAGKAFGGGFSSPSTSLRDFSTEFVFVCLLSVIKLFLPVKKTRLVIDRHSSSIGGRRFYSLKDWISLYCTVLPADFLLLHMQIVSLSIATRLTKPSNWMEANRQLPSISTSTQLSSFVSPTELKQYVLFSSWICYDCANAVYENLY